MVEEILFNSDDKTKVTLLFANTSLDDILLKPDLDKLAQKYPDRFKLYYTVDKIADKKDASSWKGEVGYVNICYISSLIPFSFIVRYITADMLKRVLPLPSKKDDESLLIMVCGPPGFMKLLSGEKTKDYKQVRSDLLNEIN